MALFINEDCINCGACLAECPNTAIYEPGEEWNMADGTCLDDDAAQDPISDEFYYIVPSKCTECVGFFDEPQCVAVCPVDAIDKDPNHEESPEELMEKYKKLHCVD